MKKKCSYIVEACYKCRYIGEQYGRCRMFKPARDIPDILEIPDWCPLEDAK